MNNKKMKVTAKEIWENDLYKLEAIKKRGFEVKIVWENEYDENYDKVLNECLIFLKA